MILRCRTVNGCSTLMDTTEELRQHPRAQLYLVAKLSIRVLTLSLRTILQPVCTIKPYRVSSRLAKSYQHVMKEFENAGTHAITPFPSKTRLLFAEREQMLWSVKFTVRYVMLVITNSLVYISIITYTNILKHAV